jgi:hypothetical protein
MDIQEVREHMEHAAEHGSAGHHNENKRVALAIAILAALLAVTELGASSAQNEYTALNVEVNDTWAFYQAKTIRLDTANAAADILTDLADPNATPERKALVEKQIATLRGEATRHDSDPATGNGRKQLLAQAQKLESERRTKLGAFHAFEFGGAALQLGVVLASAGLLTGAFWLVGVAMGLGGLAICLNLVGWFAPNLMHLVV